MRTKNKYQPSGRLELPRAAFRTAIGNGSAVLAGVDGRSLIARRYREISASIAIDLGGEDVLTEGQKQLLRTIAGLVVLRENLDTKIVNGERVNSGEYTHIANGLRRCLATVGIERRARTVNGGPLTLEAVRS